MENAVERLAALVLLLTCLSHIAAPRAWNLLFQRIRAGGETAGLVNAAIHLPLGLMIIAFHNLWTWPAALVTVIGWALVIKGAAHLLFPKLAQRTLNIPRSGAQAERRYRLAGALMLPLALAIGWIALR